MLSHLFSSRLGALLLLVGPCLLAQAPASVPGRRVAAPQATAAMESGSPGQVSAGIHGHDTTGLEADAPDFVPPDQILRQYGVKYEQLRQRSPYILAFLADATAPEPGLDPRLERAAAAEPAGTTYCYIMVRGRSSDPQKLRELERLGASVLSSHTYQSLVVRLPMASVESVASLPFVYWMGYATRDQKLDQPLRDALQQVRPDTVLQVDVSVFESDVNPATTYIRQEVPAADVTGITAMQPTVQVVPNGRFQRALQAMGFQLEYYTNMEHVFVFRGSASARSLEGIVSLDFVAALSLATKEAAFHDQSMAMISQDRIRTQYDGSTITAGQIDSGIQFEPQLTHQDVAGKRMVNLFNAGLPTAFHDGLGHGTHVAGTIMGEGVADPKFTGAVPGLARTAATAYFNARHFDNGGAGIGNVADLYLALAQNANVNGQTVPRPRVVNNSWGSIFQPSASHGAEPDCRAVDDAVWTNNQCYVFSAGNDNAWAHTPGSAKNAVTVGSCNDWWSMVGTSSSRPGDLSIPFASPNMQQGGGTCGGTADNRQKPEILAPGMWITSLDSTTTNGYRQDCGTSMAAPHLTGALVSLIQHYPHYDYRPQNLKAQLVATADWRGSASGDWVGNREGYGLINAYKLNWDTSGRYGSFSGYSTGELRQMGDWWGWDVAIPSDATFVRIALTWIEPPASAGAAQARVNNVVLYIDEPPYNTGSGGEHVYSSSTSNLVTVSSASLATALRGKTVRIKGGLVNVGANSSVRVGMSCLWHQTNSPNTLGPQLNATASTTSVAPGGSLTVTTQVSAASSRDDFENAWVFPGLPSGWTVTRLENMLPGNILCTYLNGQRPFPDWWPSDDGINLGQGYLRSATWTLRASTVPGPYDLRFSCTADPNSNPVISRTIPISVGSCTSVANPASWSTNVSAGGPVVGQTVSLSPASQIGSGTWQFVADPGWPTSLAATLANTSPAATDIQLQAAAGTTPSHYTGALVWTGTCNNFPGTQISVPINATVGAGGGAQAILLQASDVQFTFSGSAPVQQSVPANTTYGAGSGYSLHIAGGNVSVGSTFALQADEFTLSTNAFANFVGSSVAASASADILVTLSVPGRGVLALSCDRGHSGGPGFGLGFATIDVGNDGSNELAATDWTTEHPRSDVFVPGPGTIHVRIRNWGSMSSFMVDDYYCNLRGKYYPGLCPAASYGTGCFSLSAAQSATGLDLEVVGASAPGVLVFGWQQLNLPLPGVPCFQLVSTDCMTFLFGTPMRYSIGRLALPPGLQLYMQVAAFNGGQLSTSNGLALICPP